MTYTQKTWSLDDLYPSFDSPELEKAYQDLDEQVTAFEALRPTLKADMDVEDFMEMLKASEKSARLAHRLYSFAGLAFAADTQDQVAQSAQSRVEQFLADVQNRTLFFSLWWKDLADETAQRFMDAAGDYRYYLEEIRNFKPHTLSEAEEKIINIKNVTGSSALTTLCLSGALPRLCRRRTDPRADVSNPGPGLGQRERQPAQFHQSHLRPQPRQRHPRRSRQYLAPYLREKCGSFPTLL